MVLVQGTADVDDSDLAANRERYRRDASAKLPGGIAAPRVFSRLRDWYYTRIYIHVRPERVYVWADGGAGDEPLLLDSHMEEVHSGHDEEPDAAHAQPAGGEPAWDRRIEEVGGQYPTAIVSLVAPDGFPFSVRAPVTVDRERRRLRIERLPPGVPMRAGLTCVCAHEHDERFSWRRNFQIRGDLVEDGDGWAVVPQRIVGGFELPPGSTIVRLRENFGKMQRFRRRAKRERARRRA